MATRLTGKHVMMAIGMVTLLTACNGKEDFSDAVIGGDPLGSGFPGGANFNASDACSPRVVGALVDAGTVSNIRYECDGFYGYTGVTGIERETSQNFFVCPLGSSSVTFLLGGRTASLDLGTGYFRSASQVNQNGCQYDYALDEFIVGQYDADGIYLFSLSDIVDGPARIDAETDDSTDEAKQVRNASALLQALDTAPDDGLITINQTAHDIIFDSQAPYAFSDTFLVQDFATFTAPGGEAQNYLDAVEAAGGAGAVSASGFPDAGTVVDAITSSNRATASGVYRFQMIVNSLVDAALVQQGIFNNPVLYGDGLVQQISAASINPDAPEGEIELDLLLYQNVEFLPTMLVTRRGTVSMGGSFHVVDFQNTGKQCVDGKPDYSAFQSSSYSLLPTLNFSNWMIDGDRDAGSLNFTGRIIGDYAFNGASVEDSFASDYSYIYPNLPADAYQFDEATDRTSLDGNYCDQVIDDQPVLTLLRGGVVAPIPDVEVMTSLTQSGPMQYSLRYLARSTADVEAPDTPQGSDLPVTIHSDGAIFTDLNTDGNVAYDGSAVPAGEYEVGMVSSVFRSPLAPPDDVDRAVINILLYNYGPLASSASIPKYGTQFRARLVPDVDCVGDNAAFAPGDVFTSSTDPAVWYNAYAAVDVINSAAVGEAGDTARYQGMRTRAYGYLEARRSDCP